MDIHIKAFLEYIRVEKRYSPKTVLAYRTDLEQFFSFVRSHVGIETVEEVKHHSVRAWIVFIMSEKGKAVTVNRKISALRSFYKWAVKMKVTETNPMLKVTAPKKPKKLPEVVPGKNMSALFDMTLEESVNEDEFTVTRDRFLLRLLYATGMRRAEIISLTLQCVDISRKEIRVTGKGNKVRSIPFTEHMIPLFQQYLEIRAKVQGLSTEVLFVRDNGKPMYEKLVYNIVQRKLSEITTLDKKSPHVLRHTFATHMLDEGADLNAIKELLGHASLAATQIYTHNSIAKLKEVYKKAHPEG